jgi:tagatose-1,6-bisphosphate aldolase
VEASARFPDGTEIGERVFGALAKAAPDGHLTVLACDQHNSFLRMLTQFNAHARAAGGSRAEFPDEATDEQVARLSATLARSLGGAHAAALFNHLGYMQAGFRQMLAEKGTMLLGRLEDTEFDKSPDGKGAVPRLAVRPEDAADRVDGFKTLVKVDPGHDESWKLSLEWLENVWQRCRALGKPLFNETLYVPVGRVSALEKARKLPRALVEIAAAFGPYGDFYKTQVPMLWLEDDGTPVNSPAEIRGTMEEIREIVDRPLLVLSAAVSFPQYAAQMAAVCDLVVGPMCGRAYFKDPFSDPSVTTWEALEEAIGRVALPRMSQIHVLASRAGLPWWHKFEWMSDEARGLVGQ